MKIEQAISSCKAVFNYALDSNLVHSLIFIFFITVPLLKILATLLKTINKTRLIKSQCSNKLPKKLLAVIEKNGLDQNSFLVSNSPDFFAVSIGIVAKKIVLSKFLISFSSTHELEAIVLHEAFHTKFYHSLLLFLTEVVAATFFFLPIFKDFQSQIKLEFEKAADTFAVKNQGTAKYVKDSLRKAIIAETDFGMFPQFSYQVIDQRIDSLNSKKSKINFKTTNLIHSLIVVFVFLSIFLLNKKYAVASEMEQKITCSLMDCMYECVALEFTQQPAMSEVNFSFDK